jgi:tetratricopeptide (TPR) repeat protein
MPLFVIALLVLGRSANFEFVNLDDRNLLADNPKFNPPTWSSILGFILPRNLDENLYIPITQFAWGAIAALGHTQSVDASGTMLNPWAFHCANLLAHLACIAMVFTILRCFAEDWIAWVGAAIFAVHPMQVETVAWISAFRDLLSCLLALLSLWRFIRFRQSGRLSAWIGASVLALLAMLAKPSAVALPFEAAALDCLLLRTRWPAMLRSLAPWVAMAVPIVLITRHAQPMLSLQPAPPMLRPLIALDALAFYLRKFFWPLSLTFDYGRTPRFVLHPGWRMIWLLPIVAAAILLLGRRHWPMLFAGMAIATAALLPVLGLVPFAAQDYSTVSDHYLYPAMLGICLAIAGLLQSPSLLHRPRATATAVALLLALLAGRSFDSCAVWRDSASLFSHAMQINPQSSIANAGYASGLADAGQFSAAINYYRRAEQLNPRNGSAFAALGQLLLRMGDSDGAADQFAQLLHIYRAQSNFDPIMAAATEVVVAQRLLRHGDVADAIADLEQAKRWDPSNRQIDPMLIAARALPSPQSAPTTQ